MRCSKFNATLLLQCCFNNVLHLPPFAPYCWALRPQCRAVASMVGYAHIPAIASIRPYALRYGAIWYHTTHNSVKRRAALREHWPTSAGRWAGALPNVDQPAPRGSSTMSGALGGSNANQRRADRRQCWGVLANSAARIAGTFAGQNPTNLLGFIAFPKTPQFGINVTDQSHCPQNMRYYTHVLCCYVCHFSASQSQKKHNTPPVMFVLCCYVRLKKNITT